MDAVIVLGHGANDLAVDLFTVERVMDRGVAFIVHRKRRSWRWDAVWLERGAADSAL